MATIHQGGDFPRLKLCYPDVQLENSSRKIIPVEETVKVELGESRPYDPVMAGRKKEREIEETGSDDRI